MPVTIKAEWPTDLAGKPHLERTEHSSPGMRLRLSRRWQFDGPVACVIGHNPSTADGLSEDPMTLWLNTWFAAAGFAGYTIVNLYPWRSPDPREVYKRVALIEAGHWDVRDELYYLNLDVVTEAAKSADQVFVCWGAIARDQDWIEHIVENVQSGEAPWPDLWCWGKTKSGAPTHPMARGKHRIARDQEAIIWKAPIK